MGRKRVRERERQRERARKREREWGVVDESGRVRERKRN